MVPVMRIKRVFVAVEVSNAAKSLAAKHGSQLRRAQGDLRVSWVPPERMHITLRFLGDIGSEELSALSTAIEGMRNDPVRLTMDHTGVFPHRRRPTVLWFGMSDEKSRLQKTKADLDRRLEEIGFPLEKREYRPHLTIARLREPRKSQQLAESHLAFEFQPVAFEVKEMVVYESRLGPAGPEYIKNSAVDLT